MLQCVKPVYIVVLKVFILLYNCVNYSIITSIMYLRMPIFCVWNADRTIKKTVVSTPEIEALKKKKVRKIMLNFLL